QSLLQTFLMTLFINGRHVFYGLSFIEKFREMGKAYPYMVCSLTDETYSVLCNLKVPEGMDEKKVSFWISLLDQFYWVIGSVAGGLLGQWLSFDTKGIDFSMTALFVVIVVNQWMENKNHISTLTGFMAALLFLAILGPDHFLLPALILSMMLLIVFRKTIDTEADDMTIKEGRKA
ncbi:MAG: AzlC family ABC transporter permease, partial [Lachnospiraceae bacterium]